MPWVKLDLMGGARQSQSKSPGGVCFTLDSMFDVVLCAVQFCCPPPGPLGSAWRIISMEDLLHPEHCVTANASVLSFYISPEIHHAVVR